MMNPAERKMAFKTQAMRDSKTFNGAAYEACGVTWFHLSDGIADKRPLSDDVKQKFAAYIGQTVETVFGDDATETSAA
jgi:hypothetical protein